MQTPSVGRIVHYVSYGTPGGEYPKACRAATVTEVDPNDPNRVGLCVTNPTGLFFHDLASGGCRYDGGAETPGTPDCADRASHGQPFRYCGCGWREAGHKGGTWHWPERVPETLPRPAGELEGLAAHYGATDTAAEMEHGRWVQPGEPPAAP